MAENVPSPPSRHSVIESQMRETKISPSKDPSLKCRFAWMMTGSKWFHAERKEKMMMKMMTKKNEMMMKIMIITMRMTEKKMMMKMKQKRMKIEQRRMKMKRK